MHCRCLANIKLVFSDQLHQHFLRACKGVQTPEGWGLAMTIFNFENQVTPSRDLLENRIIVGFFSCLCGGGREAHHRPFSALILTRLYSCRFLLITPKVLDALLSM